MADRVILHVGPRKTGTSYVQATLWDNVDRLAEQGFWLPLDSARDQLEATSHGRDGWWTTGRENELWTRLLDEVATRPGVALVSSELLGVASPEEIEAMLAGFVGVRVDVVFGVRSLGRAIPAMWQQWVRARADLTYDDWLVELRDNSAHGFWKTQDPGRLVNRWLAELPHDQIHALIVPGPDSGPGELWDRFASAVGLEPTGFVTPQTNVNESLGLAQAELLRRINAAFDPDLSRAEYATRVRRNFTGRVLIGASGARRVQLPADHVGWISERTADVHDRLVSSGVAIHGDLADLDVLPTDVADGPLEVTDAELLDVAVESILGLIARAAQRDRQIRALRSTPESASVPDKKRRKRRPKS